MFAEIGNFTLYFGLIVNLISLCIIFTYSKISKRMNYIIIILITFAFLLQACSIICLIISHFISDMSVLNVVLHSNIDKPTIYKIAGAWGSHEGSMLLWNSYLAFFAFIMIITLVSHKLTYYIITVQLFICSYFTIITIASNPFARIFPATAKGMGMNPVLQDIGLAIHPPMLYLGYISCSALFSIAAGYAIYQFFYSYDKDFYKKRLLKGNEKIKNYKSAIIYGAKNIDVDNTEGNIKDEVNIKNYVKTILKPWLFFSWSFLTIGITLGSWWAYREVGWGGYWFWDPVENASFLPWIALTSLIHALRNGSTKSLIVQSMIPFILSVGGTFFVRSGLISSVHSFASDEQRAKIILSLLIIMLIFFICTLFFLTIQRQKDNLLNYKDILSNIMLAQKQMVICTSMILIITTFGTIYPIIFNHFSNLTISIGSEYFNYYINPIMVLIAFLSLLMHWQILTDNLGINLKYSNKNQILKDSNEKQEIKKWQKILCLKGISLIVIIISMISISIVFFWQKHGWIQWIIDKYICALSITSIVISIISLTVMLLYIFVHYQQTLSNNIKKKKKQKENITAARCKGNIENRLEKRKFSPKIMMLIAHISFAFVVMIIGLASYGSIEKQQVLSVGFSMKIHNFHVFLRDIDHKIHKNYLTKIAKIEIYEENENNIVNSIKDTLDETGLELSNMNLVHTLYPELRFFFTEKQMTVESDIMHSIFYDLHLSISEIGNNPELLVRVYYRPMLSWLWCVGIILGICGLIYSIKSFYFLIQSKKLYFL